MTAGCSQQQVSGTIRAQTCKKGGVTASQILRSARLSQAVGFPLFYRHAYCRKRGEARNYSGDGFGGPLRGRGDLPPVLPVRRPFTNDVHGELPLPTQCRRLAKPPVMSPEGQGQTESPIVCLTSDSRQLRPQDFREVLLKQRDQRVTLPVRYDRNAPTKPPHRLGARQHSPKRREQSFVMRGLVMHWPPVLASANPLREG